MRTVWVIHALLPSFQDIATLYSQITFYRYCKVHLHDATDMSVEQSGLRVRNSGGSGSLWANGWIGRKTRGVCTGEDVGYQVKLKCLVDNNSST